MNYRTLDDLKLAAFAANIITQLGTTLTAIEHSVVSALSASLTPLPAELESKTAIASPSIRDNLLPRRI